MCGIFACRGRKSLIAATIKGLKILEYRGYDSAGIAYPSSPTKFTVIKAVGGIEQLAAKVQTEISTPFCLGHTRWATNGEVSEANSHPHLSANGKIAVVHNGIIENYRKCQELCAQHNLSLQTPVDTEVIPNILYLLRNKKHYIHDYLQGQYVFCAGFQDKKNTLFVAKKGNLALHIGRDNDNYYIVSDTLALPPTVNEIISLNDHETGEINDNQINFFCHGQKIQKDWKPFVQSFTATSKNGFATYMEKEINEIPNILDHIIATYRSDENLIKEQQNFHRLIASANCIHICGCGTSYHAALILATQFEKHLHIRAIAHISSEFTASTLLNEHAVAIIISQSGETADTLMCMNILRANKIPMVSLCNVSTSTIAQQCEINFPLLCGPEIAVASTKVFCATLLVGSILINRLSPKDLKALPDIAKQYLTAAYNILLFTLHKNHKIFFIGKNLDYFLALESALKVKEITYMHCEGYPANELKHGPLSLIDHRSLAFVFQGDTSNAISEISARGGKVIALPDICPANQLSFIARIIPAQVLALKLATKLKINPDKPRNLAKSVTVL